jgi:hypothetical protein
MNDSSPQNLPVRKSVNGDRGIPSVLLPFLDQLAELLAEAWMRDNNTKIVNLREIAKDSDPGI